MEESFDEELLTKTTTLNNLSTQNCVNVPPHINSRGVWGTHYNYNSPGWWLNNSLPRLEFQLLLLCISMAIIRFLLKGSGLPRISSQIIAGLIFGCSWKYWDEKRYKLFTIESQATLSVFTYFGYMLYLFVLALKMDVRMIARIKIRKALTIGLPTFFVPLICGYFVANLFLNSLDFTDQTKIPLIVNLHSMLSLPVVENILSELKIVNTEIGRLGLSAALVGDLLSQLGITASNMIRIYEENPVSGVVTLMGLFLEVFLLCFVFQPAVVWIIKRTPKGKPVSGKNIQGVIFLVLVSSIVSTLLARPAISGPYLLGLLIPNHGSPLVISMVEKLDSFVSVLFVPIFVTTSAIQADLSKIFIALGDGFTQLNIIIGFVTFLVKVITCFLCSLYCKLSVEDSLALSLVMSNKGVVELFFSAILRGYEIISDEVLIWLVVMILLVASFVASPVKYLYKKSLRKHGVYENKNIMNLARDSELRVLVCVHKMMNKEESDDLIHLLNLSCPTKKNPLAIFVLHLVELVGRITPIFISHSQQSSNPLSQEEEKELEIDKVFCFENFASDQNGTVSTECFTTITHNKLMHNEICRLAVEKTTSLIILPFHQTWQNNNDNGKNIDQNDNTIRTLNWGVIENAPCSVAIFANRGHLGSMMRRSNNSNTYSACVIFIGGKDDREAISYAKRLAKDDSRVELTVLRLMCPKIEDVDDRDRDRNNWEIMLDSEIIRDFKMNCSEFFGDGRVKYLEGVSENGNQTALRVREMVNEFDLMIVGRRKNEVKSSSSQTSGLTEMWSDFPELGILGDLIVSLDVNIRASVLVIHANIS